MTTIFNEYEFAENIYLNGFPNPNNILFGQMVYLCRYLREKLEYGEVKIRAELIRIAQESQPFFNVIIRREQINRAVRKALKKNDVFLRQAEKVVIYKDEIEFIQKIKHFNAQVFLLSAMIYSKWASKKRLFCSFYARDIREIISLGKINVSATRVLKEYVPLFSGLNLTEVVLTGMNLDVLYRIKFESNKKEVAFEVYNFSEIRSQYIQHLGGEIFYCKKSSCGKAEVRKSNRQGLCKECYREYRKSYVNEKVKDFRNVNS